MITHDCIIGKYGWRCNNGKLKANKPLIFMSVERSATKGQSPRLPIHYAIMEIHNWIMDKHNVIVDIGYLIMDIDELWITMIKSWISMIQLRISIIQLCIQCIYNWIIDIHNHSYTIMDIQLWILIIQFNYGYPQFTTIMDINSWIIDLHNSTRYVDGTPTSEVTPVTIWYIHPPHHGYP